MNRTTRSTRVLRQIGALVCLALLLAGCTIEGGVPPAVPADLATQAPYPTNASIAAARAAHADVWTIGMLDKPQDLYPYPADVATQRTTAPLTELLFPSPILAYNYGYTSTGVLERIPTIENGDAQL